MKKLFAVMITVVFIGFLLIGISEMPPFGYEDNPANNEVANRYIEGSIDDTGAINVVSAMILDYRAFDTYVEASVIFTALIVVMAVLKEGGIKFED
ncbi:MAG: hypothetical protein JW702_05775 [Clostridiales bacterium]|nr:hypothetical protein [Clostridiales bacterium]